MIERNSIFRDDPSEVGVHNVRLFDHQKGKGFGQSPAPVEALLLRFLRNVTRVKGGNCSMGCIRETLAEQGAILKNVSGTCKVLRRGVDWGYIIPRGRAFFQIVVS